MVFFLETTRKLAMLWLAEWKWLAVRLCCLCALAECVCVCCELCVKYAHNYFGYFYSMRRFTVWLWPTVEVLVKNR